jgi:hypothetical protein
VPGQQFSASLRSTEPVELNLKTITPPRQWGGSQINDDPVGADPRVSAALTQRSALSNHPFCSLWCRNPKEIEKNSAKRGLMILFLRTDQIFAKK